MGEAYFGDMICCNQAHMAGNRPRVKYRITDENSDRMGQSLDARLDPVPHQIHQMDIQHRREQKIVSPKEPGDHRDCDAFLGGYRIGPIPVRRPDPDGAAPDETDQGVGRICPELVVIWKEKKVINREIEQIAQDNHRKNFQRDMFFHV